MLPGPLAGLRDGPVERERRGKERDGLGGKNNREGMVEEGKGWGGKGWRRFNQRGGENRWGKLRRDRGGKCAWGGKCGGKSREGKVGMDCTILKKIL